MKSLRKRLTYANVMSSLAIFLVLGGATAFAATKIGSNEIKANAILTGKIKKEAVTEGKIKAGAIGNTRLANGAVTETKLATGAVTASKINTSGLTVPLAQKANEASNAISLGGIPASGYTRSDCNSLTGQIKGFARINDAAVSTTTLSTAGVEAPYNCSGGQVLARRGTTGHYEVKFVGSPVTIALATSMSASASEAFDVNFASANRITNGTFFVQLWNAPLSSFINDSFTILVP
jgi:trimeric autotransporter adhesin